LTRIGAPRDNRAVTLSTESNEHPRPDELSFPWDSGDLRLWIPAPNVFFVTMRGQGQGRVMKPFSQAAPPPTAKHFLFYDLWELESYESELRKQMTSWVMERRSLVAEMHVLLRSKLVSMGVSVANLALGGIITTHTQRAPFQKAFDRVLAGR
jgi:hypothetical protein